MPPNRLARDSLTSTWIPGGRMRVSGLRRAGAAVVMAGAMIASPLAAPASAGTQVLPIGNSFSVVAQVSGGTLLTADSKGNAGTDTGFVIAAGTTPAIAGLVTGGTEIAWQSTAGTLNVAGPGGIVATGLPMRAGTSPSITGLPTGGFQVAFHGSNGNLWVYGTRGTKDWGTRMAPNTSPSITTTLGGPYAIAIHSIVGKLYLVQEGFQFGFALGMPIMPGTSPAIAGPPTIGVIIAFQDPDGTLVYFSSVVGPRSDEHT